MSLFNKKPRTEVQHESRVEVVVNKEANKQVVEDAKEANKRLNTLLQKNGFTLKIFLAAGGSTNKRKLKHEH
jgi:intracellular sulfur oxidation DsrE/DsrF family protein